MNDLISRQAAIDAIQQHREGVLGGYEYDETVAYVYAAAHNHIIDVVKKLPSAQPMRKQGKWIEEHREHEVFGIKRYRRWCSCCNEMTIFPYDFCPHCGAKMEQKTGKGEEQI